MPQSLFDDCKICSICGVSKSLDQYRSCNRVKSGKKSECKECCYERQKKWLSDPDNRRKFNEARRIRRKAASKREYNLRTQTKICPRCKCRKAFEEFSVRTGSYSGRKSWCKVCVSKKIREPKEVEKRRVRYVKYRRTEKGNSIHKKANIKYMTLGNGQEVKKSGYLKSKYGITLQERDRLIELQHGKCPICRCKFTATGPRRPVVDHCHSKAGHVRGILCDRCNVAEGMLRNPETVLRLYQYMSQNELLSYQTPSSELNET